MTLTIAYITARKDCKIEWFLDSLIRQCLEQEFWPDRVIIVDFFRVSRCFNSDQILSLNILVARGVKIIHTEPKPCVWQGENRLTKQDWFAMANARNTALCYAPDGWIAYVDDLSVLMPEWLTSVKQTIDENFIGLGAYLKMDNLGVEDGRAVYYKLHQKDTRWDHAASDLVSCGGDWMYGCSLVAPVQAFLDINGWAECLCDGLGFEDVCTGIVLGNTNKYSFRYNRNMLTLESEEDHYKEPAFRKEDWHWEGDRAVVGGNGGNDKSHSALNQARSTKRFEQYFGNDFPDIAALRQHVLGGGKFPVRGHPEHDWYTRIPLKDL